MRCSCPSAAHCAGMQDERQDVVPLLRFSFVLAPGIYWVKLWAVTGQSLTREANGRRVHTPALQGKVMWNNTLKETAPLAIPETLRFSDKSAHSHGKTPISTCKTQTRRLLLTLKGALEARSEHCRDQRIPVSAAVPAPRLAHRNQSVLPPLLPLHQPGLQDNKPHLPFYQGFS